MLIHEFPDGTRVYVADMGDPVVAPNQMMLDRARALSRFPTKTVNHMFIHNRRVWCRNRGVKLSQVARLATKHCGTCKVFERDRGILDTSQQIAADRFGDSLVSTTGQPLGLLAADCVPIFYWHPTIGVISFTMVSHVSMGSASRGVFEQARATMLNLGLKASQLRVYVGPMISRAACEVDKNYRLADVFKECDAFRETKDKYYLDLRALVAYKLFQVYGVTGSQITWWSDLGTYENTRLWSNRKCYGRPGANQFYLMHRPK